MRPTLVLALCASLAFAGCMTGGDDKTPTPTPTPAPTPTATPTASPTPTPALDCDVTVDISGFAYSPANATVPSGGTICWTNKDTVAHTVTFDRGAYDSGSIAPGATVSAQLGDGLHAYHCTFHASMTGTVQMGPVQATPTPTPPTPPTPTPTPTPTATPTGPATATVTILAFQFTPQTVTIARGGTVTWTNNDAVPHTATANDASWDTGSLATGASKPITFANPGTFDYKCKFHSTMTGKVVVN